jgi:uncharacterized membrane protein
MSTLALIRVDELNFPLFVHVLGAMILVGATLTAASAAVFARGDEGLLRIGYWSLLAVGLPGYIVMRVGAEWIYSKENVDDVLEDRTWVGIGYIVADAGALLVVISLILGGIGLYRLRTGGGRGLLTAALWISVLLLAAEILAIWAMGAKPD